MKLLILLLVSVLLWGCESVQTRRPELNSTPNLTNSKSDQTQIPPVPDSLKPSEPSSTSATDLPLNLPSSVTPLAENPGGVVPSSPLPPPQPTPGERPHIGILLGPGGVRAFAHIGVLQELLKARIPISSVVGFESGALVGGIFAAKGQPYDVEWQMMKLHEEDFVRRSLISSDKPQDVSRISDFIKNAVGNLHAEDSKINFACPSYNLVKRQTFIMSRGPMTAMLPFCIPYAPFFRPHQQSIAGMTSVTGAIKYLRSKGINYIIYVDLLGEKTTPYFPELDSEVNIAWSTVAEANESQLPGVNKVITVPLQGYYITDFAKRREILQRGQETGRASAREVATELGL